MNNFVRRVAQAGLGNLPTFENTWTLVEDLLRRGIRGDLIECGVFAGAHPAIMAKVLQEQGDTRKRVHLFDSFQGIPEAGPEDDQQPGIGPKPPGAQGRLISSGVSACSLVQVKANMMNWGVDGTKLVFHEGWFQKTVPAAKIDEIALLRLDGDLYESTKVCLKHLGPKVSHGGFIVIDDFGLAGCRKAVAEYRDEHGRFGEVIGIPGGGGPAYWMVAYPSEY